MTHKETSLISENLVVFLYLSRLRILNSFSPVCATTREAAFNLEGRKPGHIEYGERGRTPHSDADEEISAYCLLFGITEQTIWEGSI